MTRSCRFWFVKQTFLPQNHLMWTARTSARFQANYEFISPAQKICRTIALRAVTNYRPETDKQTETFVWLLSLKCHVCQSSVIKMKKMTKLRQNCKLVTLTLFARYAICSALKRRIKFPAMEDEIGLVGRPNWIVKNFRRKKNGTLS